MTAVVLLVSILIQLFVMAYVIIVKVIEKAHRTVAPCAALFFKAHEMVLLENQINNEKNSFVSLNTAMKI